MEAYTSNLWPELTTNGTFNGNLTGWTNVWWVTNTLNASWNALITYSFASGGLFQDIPTTANIVKVVIRARMVQANVSLWTIPRTWNFNAPNTTTGITNNLMQDYTFYVYREATATGIRIYLNASTSGILEVESVSAKEVWVVSLSNELISNWDFSSDGTWWLDVSTAPAYVDFSWTWAVLVSNSNTSRLRKSLTTVPWKRYFVTLNHNVTNSVARFSIGMTAGSAEYLASTAMPVWTFTCSFTATTTETWFSWFSSWTPNLEITSLSVKEQVMAENCTLFQDIAWTVPVTSIEQPVWLMLDKSKNLLLWNELIPNWDFSTTTNWSTPAGWVISGWICTATTTVSSLKYSPVCTAGRFYIVEFDWTHTAGTLYVRVWTWPAITFTTSGRKRVILMANDTNGFEAYGWAVSGMLDNVSVKELQWNHAYQTTAIDRLILRRWIPNIQLHSNTYSNAVWTLNNCTQAIATGEFIDWVQATRLTVSWNWSSIYAVGNPIQAIVGQTYTISTYVRQWTTRYVQLTLPWALAWLTQYANYDLQDWIVTFSTGGTASILAVTWWYIITWSALCTLSTTPQSFGAIVIIDWPNATRVPTVSLSWQTILIATTWVFVWAYTADDIENKFGGIPNTTTASVNTRLWNWYLACNGTNTWMRTNNINFNSDKLTWFIWVRMLAGSSTQMLVESSTSYSANTWAFELSLNEVSAWGIIPAYKSSLATQYKLNSSNVIPRSVVATFQFNTALKVASWWIVFRENWTALDWSNSWVSTWTIFGNYPLYLFRRWLSTLPFNGNFYWLILRWALSTNKQITDTESYLTKKLW